MPVREKNPGPEKNGAKGKGRRPGGAGLPTGSDGNTPKKNAAPVRRGKGGPLSQGQKGEHDQEIKNAAASCWRCRRGSSPGACPSTEGKRAFAGGRDSEFEEEKVAI